MLSVKLVVIMILASALFTAGISQLRPALAISIQKQQLLDKIFSEEEDARNETSVAASESDNVKNNIQNIKDDILNEAGLTLSKDEAKQVNQDDNKILSVHASAQGSNCRSGDVLSGASNKKDLKILSKCE